MLRHVWHHGAHASTRTALPWVLAFASAPSKSSCISPSVSRAPGFVVFVVLACVPAVLLALSGAPSALCGVTGAPVCEMFWPSGASAGGVTSPEQPTRSARPKRAGEAWRAERRREE